MFDRVCPALVTIRLQSARFPECLATLKWRCFSIIFEAGLICPWLLCHHCQDRRGPVIRNLAILLMQASFGLVLIIVGAIHIYQHAQLYAHRLAIELIDYLFIRQGWTALLREEHEGRGFRRACLRMVRLLNSVQVVIVISDTSLVLICACWRIT